LFNALTSYANIYFYIFIAVLVILFFDGIRDVLRYSKPLTTDDLRTNPNAETVLHMKLFRSQRNFYIAGFALFLCLVLRRLVTLISNQAQLQAGFEAAQRQAESATAAAKQFLEDKDNKANEEGEETQTKKELTEAKELIADLTEELRHKTADVAAIKQQAEATNTEYDRLLKEHETLQNKLKELEGSKGCKKEE
jgi:B-cell receptor-associated protein 31